MDATDVLDVQSAGIIDTTAELLGRATSKRPRARTSSQRKAPPVKKASSTRRTPVERRSPRPRRTTKRLSADRLLEKVHPLFDERDLRALGLLVRARVAARGLDVFGAGLRRRARLVQLVDPLDAEIQALRCPPGAPTGSVEVSARPLGPGRRSRTDTRAVWRSGGPRAISRPLLRGCCALPPDCACA